MINDADRYSRIAAKLVALHEQPFGGKAQGRFRIAEKLVRRIAGVRRLYEDDIRHLQRAMVERGFILIDMDGFFVVMSGNSFVNTRRANEECLE